MLTFNRFLLIALIFVPIAEASASAKQKEQIEKVLLTLSKSVNSDLSKTVAFEKKMTSGQIFRIKICCFDIFGENYLRNESALMKDGSIHGKSVIRIGNPFYTALILGERNQSFQLSKVTPKAESKGESFHPIIASKMASAWGISFVDVYNRPETRFESVNEGKLVKMSWEGKPFWQQLSENQTDWSRGEFIFDIEKSRCVEQKYWYSEGNENIGRYLILYHQNGDVQKWVSYDWFAKGEFVTESEVIESPTSDPIPDVQQCYLNFYGLPEPPWSNKRLFFTETIGWSVAIVAVIGLTALFRFKTKKTF